MQDKDKKMLASLIKEYDFEEFVLALRQEMKNHIDELSDLGLKDRSIKYHNNFNKLFNL